MPGNSVATILWLSSSVLIIWTRKQFVLFPIQFITIILTQLLASGVSSTCFLPCLTRSASRILSRINFVPVTFKFVAFSACLGIVHARGGYSQKNWVGVCGPLPKNPTLFMTKICDIPYPIYDLTKNSKPYL